MKYLILVVISFLLYACQFSEQKRVNKDNSYEFFVGTYTAGESEGIYKYLLYEDGNMEKIGLVAKTKNPSFLALSSDKKTLLSVCEVENKNGVGFVESFSLMRDSLQFINRKSTGGAYPCFVSINPANFVLVANYSGGNVGLFEFSESGRLSEILDLQQHIGSGSHLRQKSAHAHSAWFSPFSNDVIAVDLGTNELWISQLNEDNKTLDIESLKKLKMEEGAGPRHLVFHPNGKWIYVINELNSSISLAVKENETYEKSNSVSTLSLNFDGENYCGDIHISSDGNFVYASNRGHNSIAIFKVNPENGNLKLIAHELVRGNWPRNFSLSPDGDYLLVANEKSNNLISFKRDKISGLLNYVSEINAPSPVCILFNKD